MFGRAYFGGRWYGARYYGDGSNTAAPGASAAQIWNYVLSNGLTAGATLVAIHERICLNNPRVEVNVKEVNDILIQGTGAPPDHWRPA